MFIKLNHNYINLDNIKGCKFYTDKEDGQRYLKIYFIDGTAKRFNANEELETMMDAFFIPGDEENEDG